MRDEDSQGMDVDSDDDTDGTLEVLNAYLEDGALWTPVLNADDGWDLEYFLRAKMLIARRGEKDTGEAYIVPYHSIRALRVR